MSSAAWLVDASVALKWFLPAEDEPHSTQARGLIGAFAMQTTTLAEFEIANMLLRRTELPARAVVGALALLREICGEPIALESADHAPAVELAKHYGLTFYDASYAAIAARTGRPLLSADSDLTGPSLATALEDAPAGAT